MAAYKSAPIGALFDPSKGVGSTFGGDAELPRSIASDGRRWLLFSHVLVHILALAANIVSAVYFFGDFAQMQMKVGCIVAVSMHGLGILALLALAAAELKQLAYVFGMAVIFSFLLSALSATVGMAIFTFRSDDVLTEPHWLYYTSIYLQTLGLGFVVACALNMAAKGDVAIDAVAAPAAAP